MKKILAITLAAATALFLFSCKGSVGPVGSDGTDAEKGWFVATFQNGVNAYIDTYDVRIWSSAPTTNYGGDTDSLIGTQSGSVKRLIIEFYPLLPPGAAVQAATISLKSITVSVTKTSFTMYEMPSSWFEMEATWNNAKTAVAWTTPGGDFINTAASNSVAVTEAGKWYTWKVNKDLIQEKIDYGSTYGFLMKADSETGTNNVDFAMSEYGTIADRPILTIYYTLP